ncbi:hypothetical protein D3C76_846940 [compost metagenome]
MMAEDNAGDQQQVRQRSPFNERVASITGVDGLLDFVDGLPYPYGRPDSAGEKVRGDGEQCPAAFLEQGPAAFGIRL